MCPRYSNRHVETAGGVLAAIPIASAGRTWSASDDRASPPSMRFGHKLLFFYASPHFLRSRRSETIKRVLRRSPGRAVFRRVFEGETAVGYGLEDGKDLFCLKLRPDAVVPGAGFHLAFSAPSRSAVDTFHQSALRIGGQDNGKPGLRSNYATHYCTRVILLGGEKGLSLITPDERGVTGPPPLGLRARHTKEQGTSTSASAARYGLLMRHIRKLQESHSTKRRKSLNNGGADGRGLGP
jgi:hypothetical protein